MIFGNKQVGNMLAASVAEALQRYLSFAPADQRNALEKEGGGMMP